MNSQPRLFGTRRKEKVREVLDALHRCTVQAEQHLIDLLRRRKNLQFGIVLRVAGLTVRVQNLNSGAEYWIDATQIREISDEGYPQ